MKPSPGEDHTAEDNADLIVHLARLGQSGPSAARLSAAQWTALRYFDRANRFSRTPSAFSDYHATTRGTASQTVKSLVSMGLLERTSNAADGRSALLEVTDSGRAMLAADPLRDLRAVLDALPRERQRALSEALSAATEALAQRREAPCFGRCVDCRHCAPSEGDAIYCHCSKSWLATDEMAALCVDFVPLPPDQRRSVD